MAYYYLLSSLPMLKTDGTMPISYDAFLAMCKENVSDTKYAILKRLSLSSREGPLLSEWGKFYAAFREELAYQRNQRLGRKTEAPSQKDAGLIKAIASAMQMQNPLHAEEALLAFEFQKVDALIGTHYFDDHALMGYALKLRLLERKNAFEKEKGKKEVSRIIGKIEEQILHMEQE